MLFILGLIIAACCVAVHFLHGLALALAITGLLMMGFVLFATLLFTSKLFVAVKVGGKLYRAYKTYSTHQQARQY
ncbi:hypothetical protein F6X40_24030 [Paraburkholderia sp. UCT31]|uniref:hypothetical protein n=1 Tax=Paraburkholderia sp. UCT31 TaxID=2615209 RepID=UPI00165637D1|nr:hypothetical protein [Paraburkholderia sp. UCT31]MBC8739786.1 hypothetical protein [Paraburkholderia sp. UCT31]